MLPRMGDLVNRCFQGHSLAHALLHNDLFLAMIAVAVGTARNVFQGNGVGRKLCQCGEQLLIVRNIISLQRGYEFWQRLAFSLRYIIDIDRLISGYLYDGSLRDIFPVLVLQRLAVGIQHSPVDLPIIRGVAQNLDTLFAGLYMPVKIVYPGIIPGHIGSMGTLHMNQDHVTVRVAMKFAHHL